MDAHLAGEARLLLRQVLLLVDLLLLLLHIQPLRDLQAARCRL